MTNPFPAYDGEPSPGACGRADPVAWAAMTDVMHKKARYVGLRKSLEQARNDGLVVTSLELCRDMMQADAEGNVAIEVCNRMAGGAATAAAMAVGDAKEVAV